MVIDSGSAEKINQPSESAGNYEVTIAHSTADGTGGDLSATSRGNEYRTPAAKPAAAPVKAAAKPAAAPKAAPAQPAPVKSAAKAPVKAAAKIVAAPAKPAAAPKAVPAPAPKAAQAAAPAKPASGSESDLDLLARLITAEAQGEPYEAQVAVGAVVMNRVKSSDWPNTVKGVIYQEIGGYYQFTPVANGWIDKPAEPECIKAAKEAMNGTDPTGGAQFYYDDKVANKWILAKPVSTQFGHMIFAF